MEHPSTLVGGGERKPNPCLSPALSVVFHPASTSEKQRLLGNDEGAQSTPRKSYSLAGSWENPVVCRRECMLVTTEVLENSHKEVKIAKGQEDTHFLKVFGGLHTHG